MGVSEDYETSLLPGIHSPAAAMVPVPEMTVPELFLRVVKHCNYCKPQPLLASLCYAWLAQRAQPCTLLGNHSPRNSFSPHHTTPHAAAMLPFHPPTTVLLSHIVPSATSLNISSATTEIWWIYWCEKNPYSSLFPTSLRVQLLNEK